MNREQAIRAIADKIGLGPFTNNLVDAMEAVGVLKLEEEPASAASKWKVGDIVTLASGGPRMTVVQIFTGTHFQVTVRRGLRLLQLGGGLTGRINANVSLFTNADYEFAVGGHGDQRNGVRGVFGARYTW